MSEPNLEDDGAAKFVITCKTCGSEDCKVENNIRSSDLSGAWGEIQIECKTCGAYQVLWEA